LTKGKRKNSRNQKGKYKFSGKVLYFVFFQAEKRKRKGVDGKSVDSPWEGTGADNDPQRK